jgi:elongation factor Ts
VTTATISITAEDVKRLREETSAGMLDCKKALTETGGDFEAAKDLLRKKGLAAVAKRADRATSEGVIAAKVSGHVGVLVEVKCETDFVARTDEFQTLGKKVAELFAAPSPDVAGIGAMVAEVAAKCGEKTELGRTARLEVPPGAPGAVCSYIHAGGKFGVIVEIHCEKDATASGEAFLRVGKTLSMQIAAGKPRFLKREEISADVLERERAIYAEQAAATGKPAPVVEKIVAGKIDKYCSEVCLLNQEFLIAPESDAKTVRDYVAEAAKKIGEKIEVARFVRMELGE